MESVFIKNQKLNENKKPVGLLFSESKRTWNILDIALILSVPFWKYLLFVMTDVIICSWFLIKNNLFKNRAWRTRGVVVRFQSCRATGIRTRLSCATALKSYHYTTGSSKKKSRFAGCHNTYLNNSIWILNSTFCKIRTYF